MEDKEDELSLRDKFAIEILHALIARVPLKDYTDPFVFISDYWDFKAQPDIIKLADEKMEKFVRVAYRLADIMRKVRLTAFE